MKNVALFQKKAQPQADGKFKTVIGIDSKGGIIHLLNMTVGDISTLTHETQVYKARMFDKEFFEKLTEILEDYYTKYPTAQNALVSVVVPNSSVSTNVLNIPTMRRNRTEESLRVVLSETYGNVNRLKINHKVVNQNKQYTTYSVSMMNQQLLTDLYSACAQNRMTPNNVTFLANSEVNAITEMNPELIKASYIFIDIKPENTYFAFVNKGRTSGFYELPFGTKILQKNKLSAENMLFDSPEADLLVLNAVEKAKLKQLTMMQNDAAAQTAKQINEIHANVEGEEEEDNIDEYESSLDAAGTKIIAPTQKVLPKKVPLKLPKFMTRTAPTNEKEYMYENFRIFVKWTLNLLQNNKTSFPETVSKVFVNMPKEYDFLLEMANAEKDENKLQFSVLPSRDYPEGIMSNLEYFGGFCDNSLNDNHNF